MKIQFKNQVELLKASIGCTGCPLTPQSGALAAGIPVGKAETTRASE